MIYNSFQFIWLFPIIFIGYYAIVKIAGQRNPEMQRKVGNVVLLVASYLLYAQWNVAYTLLLLAVTAVTYITALLIDDRKLCVRRGFVFLSGIVLATAPLLVFKYYNFIIGQWNDVMRALHVDTHLSGLNWAIPIGISFFTLQSIGYLIDVYKQRFKAERNWLDYMLFVAFFPQITSGPISKARDLLPQIKNRRVIDSEKLSQGLRWFMWGLFLKVVMADRLGLYVDQIFGSYQLNSGTSCLAAAIGYSFQIYGDFAGYSLMAIGVGRLLGFDLINNFRQPYMSVSITDFWRRWHISLSTWLKDNIYIPLGGSRCSKIKNYWNIFATFLVSGIWHGANWTYIVWGGLHGLFQVVEKFFGLNKAVSTSRVVNALRIAVTFSLVTIAWIVFRMPTIDDGIAVIVRIFTDCGALYIPTKTMALFSLMSVAIVIAVDVVREYYQGFMGRVLGHTVVRWFVYVALSVIILLCGVFDSGQFIYVNF